jgi:NAD(P)-dependent dehydrogenase (short-subunit alcohol dehydrogenase family)
MNSQERRLHGRVAVVIGAGRGLGRAYAELLAARGAAVVVNDLGVASSVGGEASSRPANDVVDYQPATGGRAVANFGDVSDPGSAAGIIEAAVGEFGRIDIVINNAGTLVLDPIEKFDAQRFGRELTRGACPRLRGQGYGRVIMTSSTSIFGQENTVAYCTAKDGLVGMTKALALEGSAHGIRVNALAPSAFTRMNAGPLPEKTISASAELVAQAVGTTGAPPEFVAQAVAWLVHEDCTLTGDPAHQGVRRFHPRQSNVRGPMLHRSNCPRTGRC